MGRVVLPLRKFDPFQMPGDLVRRLAVGRDDLLAELLAVVGANLAAPGPPQHLCLVAPRGAGKTFLLRLLGLALDERAAADEPVHFLHLPEEMPHVLSPLAFLREIRRRLVGEGPAANTPRKREDIADWDALAAEVDRQLAIRFGEKAGLLVLCVENIKDVLRVAFRDEPARRKLRAWLERPAGRVMLIAASSAGRFDHDADKALFAIVRNIELRPWTTEETISFLNRVLLAREGHGLSAEDERIARAIAVFTGGSPRLATAMAEVLGAEDVLSAAQTLDALIDNLQEYYLNRLRDLTDEENRCIGALLTGGENASQTEVARRLGVEQSAVAQAFRKLEHDDAFLLGERRRGEKEKLYRVADRVFVHFYNVRVLYHGDERSALAPILDFLVSAFSETQRADQAERLMARGFPREAQVLFGTLTPLTGGENASQTEVARRLGVEQSAVAQAFRKLEHDDAFLLGERRRGEKEKLYRVADRVFVHFYNVRVLYHGDERSALAPILDFLVSAFSETQRADQAERLMARGFPREAQVLFGTLTPLTTMVVDFKWWNGNRDFMESVAQVLEERLPDAVETISAIRGLVRDPGAMQVTKAELEPPRLATLRAALDHLAKGQFHLARRCIAKLMELNADPWLKCIALLAAEVATNLFGDLPEQEKCARASETIAREIGDNVLLAYSMNFLKHICAVKGDLAAAERCAREIVELDYPEAWAWLRAHGHRLLSQFSLGRGDSAEAERHARRALEIAEASRRPTSIALSKCQLAKCVFAFGRNEEARDLAEASVETLLREGELDDYCDAVASLSYVLRALGQPQEAIAQSERCATVIAARAGPYLRALADARYAVHLTAPEIERTDEGDKLARARADSVIAGLEDIPLFDYVRSLALEAKLEIAVRSQDDLARLDAARQLGPTARRAGRKEIAAWALAEAVGALSRRKAYGEVIDEAIIALKELVASAEDVAANRDFIASRLANALRNTGRLADLRHIVTDIGVSAEAPSTAAGPSTLRDALLPLAIEAGDYELGVDLVEKALFPTSDEPPKRADLAFACIAGANAWKRVLPGLDDRFWSAAAEQNAGWHAASAIAQIENAQGRAAAYGVFRGAWDALRDEADAEARRTQIVRQLVTGWRMRSLSADLLGDIAATLESEAPGRFDPEARLLRELAAFAAAEGRPEALARLDPDVAAALRAVEPPVAPPPAAPLKSRKRTGGRKPTRKPRRSA